MLIECVLLSASLCHAVKDKPVLALTAAHAASAIADGVTTRDFERHGFHETISAALIGRNPTWARMAPIGAAEVIAGMWIGERLRHNHHTWIRRVWWLPQAVAVNVHFDLAIYNENYPRTHVLRH